MAKPPDDRERKAEEAEVEEEDLFEDLDEFFAPLEDADWPEGQGGAEPASSEPDAEEPAIGGPEGEETPEEWGELDIDIPEEDELLADLPLEETSLGEQEEAEAVAAEPKGAGTEPETATPGGEEPLTVDDLTAAPPEYSGLPGPEEPVLEEEATIPAPEEGEEGAEAIEAAGPETDETEPEPAAVEAAAEHFASGIRETPEEVERELLSDLDQAPPAETVGAGAPAVTEGPTWEEGAHPVEAEEPAARVPPLPGRNLTAAFASGALLAVAVIALLAVGKGPFTVLAAAVVLLGQAEFYTVMRARQIQPATLLGLVGGALMIAGAFFRGAAAVPLGLFLTMALTVIWYMAAPAASRKSTTVNAGATVLGAVYVPFLASFAILLLILPGDTGRNVFLTVVGLTVLYDVCAYAIGSLWGSRPLAPTISPQKSWEGVIGATFVLLLVSLAIVPSIEPFDASRAVGLALVIAVAAPLGDLVESALKRDLGVKDMGSILPGHGGILDRIDAILFAAPAAYYFYQLSF